MKQMDTSALFKSIITINCPFDGSGASASVTEISGYNLHMPMTHLAMKGCECFTGGQLGYLSLPTSEFIGRGQFCGSVFVRKLNDNIVRRRSVNYMFGQKHADLSKFDTKDYSLHLEKLPKKEIPNAATIIMLQVLRDKQIKYRAGCLKELARGVPNYLLDEDMVRDLGIDTSARKITCEEILAPDYESEDAVPSSPELNDASWHWEEYAPYVQERDYQMKSDLCEVRLDDDKKTSTVIKPEYSDYVKNGFKRIYRSQNGNDVY